MREVYSVGVVDALMRENIQIDGVFSVSAGSLVGINLLSKQPEILIRYNLKCLEDDRYFGGKQLISTGHIVNQHFVLHEIQQNLDKFNNEIFKELEIPFYCVVTDIEKGEADYLLLNDVFKETAILQATTSMPFVSQIVEIEGKKFLDGGIVDSIPIKFAEKLGFDRYLVVLTRAKSYRKEKLSKS